MATALAADKVVRQYPYSGLGFAFGLGLLAGAFLVRGWFASRRLGFAVGSDRAIHHMPGPSWQRTKAVAGRLLAP